MTRESRKGKYLFSTDKEKLDLSVIHGYLQRSYWAEKIPFHVVSKSVENSRCVGVYRNGKQVGFARVITDYSTFAYLGDVFILEEHRGQGLSKWLIQFIVEDPELQSLRRWLLATRDAHGLYEKVGFQPLKTPERFMERPNPLAYKRQ